MSEISLEISLMILKSGNMSVNITDNMSGV